MNGIAKSMGLVGLSQRPITVRAKRTSGREPLVIRGLPEVAARESMVRIRTLASLAMAGHSTTEGIVVDVDGMQENAGAALDLPIAVAVLRAMGVKLSDSASSEDAVFLGELSLDGCVRPVRGVLARLAGFRGEAFVPWGNRWEAGLLPGADSHVRPIEQVTDLFTEKPWPYVLPSAPIPEANPLAPLLPPADVVLASAAGLERVLLVGPPGSGKMSIARRLASAPLSPEEFRKVVEIYGAAGLCDRAMSRMRPFRAPNHTVSEEGLVGGGTHLRPGEVSLAQHGVLLLDELPEFRRSVLERLATALKSGELTVMRRGEMVRLPARPRVVVAAANPCPCGYRSCTCPEESRKRHEERLKSLTKLFGFKRFDVPLVTLADLAVGARAT